VAIAGLLLAWYLYGRRYRDQQRLPVSQRPDDPLRPALGFVFRGMEQKWKVDEIYDWILLRRYVTLSRFLAGAIDLGVIDGVSNGLGSLTQKLAARLRKLQTGYVRAYALVMLLGAILILGYLLTR
jgi:NADH-quinone oxidoreductase subunit L